MKRLKEKLGNCFIFKKQKTKRKAYLQGNVYGKGSMKGNYYRVGGKYEWEWEEGNEERKGKGK